jgi:hypothetical protein
MSWEDELDKEIPRKKSKVVVEVPLGLGAYTSTFGSLTPMAGEPQVPAVPADPITLETALSIFQTAKTANEILAYANDCSTPVWLDWLIKLTPKQVNIKGQVDVRAAFLNLGPPTPKSR